MAQTTKKTRPYLYYIAIGFLVAILLLGIILALSLSKHDTPSDDPSISADGESEISSTSDVSRTPSVQTPSEQEVSGVISLPGLSEEEESGESDQPVVVEPPVSGAGRLPAQPETAKAYEQKVNKAYSIDMNPYEQYVCPADPMEYVFLVDAAHTLAADFEPADLVNIKYMKPGRPDYYSKMRFVAEKALQAFLEEGQMYGIDDVLVSNGYRSYDSQAALFNSYLAQERAAHPDETEEQIEARVLVYSLRPGTSEHQSGLCVDMHNQKQTDLSFAGTEAALWLEANCYRFGFVLRYPKDKENITTVMFEPWHFRFVGRDAATEMHELGMCLEEYCAYKGIQ